MGSAQTFIDSVVGPLITLIPLGSYPDGTYDPTNTTGGITGGALPVGSGQIADVSNYRGAIMQVIVQRPQSTQENNCQVIPHHGPCPDFVTHDPFGADWGWKINGKDHATTPGITQVRELFIDTTRTMSHLSCEVTLQNMVDGPTFGEACLLGVVVIPVIPKRGARLDDWASGDLIRLFSGDDLDLLQQNIGS